MKSKVYTATGDGGSTGLVGGGRVSKDDARVEAYGTIDELNAFIGLLVHDAILDAPGVHELLRMVQNKLFNIGGYLATEGASVCKGLDDSAVRLLEAKIDELDGKLPPLAGFVLPCGCRATAMCNVCRTVARRAERRVVTLSHKCQLDSNVLKFLNRLSDFLFVLGRCCNVSSHADEVLWEG